jgi:hypothetical protein
MRPAAASASAAAPGWRADETVQVTVKGTTAKEILAGTFKYQIYETGTKSFIASGNSPYFKCDNKGCDTDAPVALHWDKETKGAFTLDMNLALPKMTSASKEFRLVLWGEDQDHFPYDFTATLTFDYAAKKAEEEVAPVEVGGEPASCIAEAKKLCGSCTGKGRDCWVKCARQHKAALRAAGCTKSGDDAAETLNNDADSITPLFDADSHIGKVEDYQDQHRFGPGGEKRGFGPGGGLQRLFGPGATEPVKPDVPPVASSNIMSFLFGARDKTFKPCGADTRCSLRSRHCKMKRKFGVVSRDTPKWIPDGCCETDAVPVYPFNSGVSFGDGCCPKDKPIASAPHGFNHNGYPNRWTCKASQFRR